MNNERKTKHAYVAWPEGKRQKCQNGWGQYIGEIARDRGIESKTL